MRLVCLACLLGCRASQPAQIDATTDAPFDTTDASPNMVDASLADDIVVHVYGDGVNFNEGEPAPGVATYFIAPDQSVQKVLTNGGGLAWANSPAGTTVLIARRYGSIQWTLVAYTGLGPGDRIVVGITTPLGPNTVIGTVAFSVPSYPGATYYYVNVSCSSGTDPTYPANVLDCPSLHTASAVAVAMSTSGTGTPPLAYSVRTNLDLPTLFGTTVSMPALQPAATITGSFTNLPSTTTSVPMNIRYLNGADTTIFGASFPVAYVSGGAASTSSTIAHFGDHTETRLRFWEGTYGAVDYFARSPQLVTNVQVDGATMIHPAMGPVYNVGSQTVSWTESPEGVDAVVVTAGLRWTTSSNVSVIYLWYSPRGPTASVPIPALPPDLGPIAYTLDQSLTCGARLETYVGATYHDAVTGHAADAAIWSTSL